MAAVTVAFLLFLQAGGGEALLRQGLDALKAGNADQAREALEAAARQDPNAPVIWLALADARLRTGDAAQAAGAVDQATRLAPQSPMVVRGREMFARRMGETARQALDQRDEKRAEAILAPAVKTFPREAELWRLFGLALYAQGRNREAVDAFVRAIDLRPGEESLYAGLETLLPAGKAVESRLAGFALRQPQNPLGWYLLGLERSDARLFAKAWNLDKNFWPAAYQMHRTAAPAEAIGLLERVVALNPDYAPAWYALSQLYARQGDREKAAAARKRHHELTRP